jgi:mannose-6-phosphate isomerase
MSTAKPDQPLFLESIMMERVWGGNRLPALFGKPLPQGKTIGESWEVVDRPEAQSRVDGGPYASATLRQMFQNFPNEMLGSLAAQKPQSFPLLLKYVDAGTPLSVQVHPDDENAKAYKDRGKSECWIIVHAEPGAQITRGLKPGITRAVYEKAVAEDRVEEVLHTFTPKVGDLVALPAGMVHAIGSGLVVAEIQQNSDVTLRIYDYKRLGLDGKPRQLHVREALGAIRFERPGDEFAGDMTKDTVQPLESKKVGGATIEHLLQGKYFDLWRYTLGLNSSFELKTQPEAPRVLMCIAGAGKLGERDLRAGQSVLLPASCQAVNLRALTESLTVLVGTPTAASC